MMEYESHKRGKTLEHLLRSRGRICFQLQGPNVEKKVGYRSATNDCYFACLLVEYGRQLIQLELILVLHAFLPVMIHTSFKNILQYSGIFNWAWENQPCLHKYLPYCLELWLVLYKRLVLFSGLGKQHYNKNECRVSNKHWVFCGSIIIIIFTWYF